MADLEIKETLKGSKLSIPYELEVYYDAKTSEGVEKEHREMVSSLSYHTLNLTDSI